MFTARFCELASAPPPQKPLVPVGHVAVPAVSVPAGLVTLADAICVYPLFGSAHTAHTVMPRGSPVPLFAQPSQAIPFASG